MEVYEESIEVHTDEGRSHHDQPEEVVIILPDESCFEYEGVKKPRMDGGKSTWSKAQTYMLIEEYKLNKDELENPSSTKSLIWEKIAEKYNEKWSTTFNGDACANKWRSMKNTYKRVRFSQRSEPPKKRWEFYDALHEVYKGVKMDRPNTNKLLGSLGSTDQQQAVHIVQFAPHGSLQHTQTYSPMRLSSPEPSHYEEQNAEPPLWFKDFMQEYRRSEDLKMKFFHQMHRDLVRLGERQCNSLDKLLVQLKNP